MSLKKNAHLPCLHSSIFKFVVNSPTICHNEVWHIILDKCDYGLDLICMSRDYGALEINKTAFHFLHTVAPMVIIS